MNKNLQISEFLLKTLELGENAMLSSGINNGSDSNWSAGDEVLIQRRRHYDKPKWSSSTTRLHTVTVSQVPLKEAKLNWRGHGIWRCGTIVEATNLIPPRKKEGRKIQVEIDEEISKGMEILLRSKFPKLRMLQLQRNFVWI